MRSAANRFKIKINTSSLPILRSMKETAAQLSIQYQKIQFIVKFFQMIGKALGLKEETEKT